MALDPKTLQQLKEQLEKEAGEIEAQLKEGKKTTNFGDDVESDFSEEADEAEELAQKTGVQEAFKDRLDDIERALDKMTKGQYGICEKCKMEIELKVLKVNPESRWCQACKLQAKQ